MSNHTSTPLLALLGLLLSAAPLPSCASHSEATHQRPPSPASGSAPELQLPDDPAIDNPDLFAARAFNELVMLTEMHITEWGLDKVDRWDADFERGEIVFSKADGTRIIAHMQVVGTIDTTAGTWLWAWENPSIAPHLTKAASLAKLFGEKHELPALQTPLLTIEEDEAWKLTALAMKLGGLQGAYRGPSSSGELLIFMAFGPIMIVNPQSPPQPPQTTL